jgi:hypothetical protein
MLHHAWYYILFAQGYNAPTSCVNKPGYSQSINEPWSSRQHCQASTGNHLKRLEKEHDPPPLIASTWHRTYTNVHKHFSTYLQHQQIKHLHTNSQRPPAAPTDACTHFRHIFCTHPARTRMRTLTQHSHTHIHTCSNTTQLHTYSTHTHIHTLTAPTSHTLRAPTPSARTNARNSPAAPHVPQCGHMREQPAMHQRYSCPGSWGRCLQDNKQCVCKICWGWPEPYI